MTSAGCRDGVLDPEKKTSPSLKVLESSEMMEPGALSVSVVGYTSQGKDHSKWYMVRAFVASGDICGDLEFSSREPISAQDADLKAILSSYALDASYAPTSNDAFVYAETLYRAQMFQAAGPIFELALARVADAAAPWPVKTARRLFTDQAGMSYGVAGQISKARAIFEKGIAEDPDYPMYYYSLACADAEEKKLGDARLHLQAAFARKANMIAGETLPDPTTDDSFLPFKQDKDFWAFLERLNANR